MKGTPSDVWTWPIQTNAGHQHSIKQSFHTAAKGRRLLATGQAEGHIL